jgi:uncharacterized iron-regulated membrane protein
MKLSPHAFTRFWDVHAWSGVIGGLVLYLMCFTGSITLFHEQLRVWEEPLAQRAATAHPLHAVLEHGLAVAGPIDGEPWFYPPGRQHGLGRLSYRAPGDPEWKQAWIDVEGPSLVPERERLTSFLYSLHFLRHDATGEWLYYLAGLLAVALLLAIVTGVLIHLKDLIRQLHQFRPEKSRRVMWSDMHKVLGVMGLPFQLMYAYTGAFIVLGPLVLQVFIEPVFGGNQQRADELAWGLAPPTTAEAGPRAAVLSADELFHRALDATPGIVESVKLIHHGRENGIFEVRAKTADTPRGRVTVQLREVDGEVLHLAPPRNEGATAATQRWILGLHFASFGGLVLRLLFFVLGLATCVTILTGNWIWLARRETDRASAGNRLLSRLTTGFGVGVPVATATLFLASRLLPLAWSARGRAEELIFILVLAFCIAWALAVRDAAAVWWQGLAAAGVALLPVPLLATRWSEVGLFGSGLQHGSVVGVDIALLLASLSLLAGGAGLRVGWLRRRLPAKT